MLEKLQVDNTYYVVQSAEMCSAESIMGFIHA